MRQIFKQRIVGAVVLVALGVIFLPFLFNLEPPRPIDTTSQIPPAPDIAPVTVTGAERRGDMVPPKPYEEAFLPQHPVVSGESATPVEGAGDPPSQASVGDEQEPSEQESHGQAPHGQDSRKQESARQATPILTEEGADNPAQQRPALAGNTLESWVVQVASVRDQSAANTLRDRLLAAGHKAYVRSAQAGGGTTYRIFVGPMALKERAVADKAVIDKAFGVQSMVVRYEP